MGLRDRSILDPWLANRLLLNISKTVYMDFSPRPMMIPKIKFGDLELLSMKETKLLGINLDNNLSLAHHLNILYNKLLLNKRLLALSKNTLSIMAKLSIYYVNIYRYLTYTIIVWGSVLTDSKFKKLYKIQKEYVRYIANTNKLHTQIHNLKKIKILKMRYIIQLKFTHNLS